MLVDSDNFKWSYTTSVGLFKSKLKNETVTAGSLSSAVSVSFDTSSKEKLDMESKRDEILYEMYVKNPTKKAQIPHVEMMNELAKIKLEQKEKEKRDQRLLDRERIEAREKSKFYYSKI